MALALIACAAFMPIPAHADEGWLLERFTATITIRENGMMEVEETVEADFGTLQKHGIFRDLRTRFECEPVNDGPVPLYPCPGGKDRIYKVAMQSVSDADGESVPFKIEGIDRGTRIKIGDPDSTVTGRQTYRIRYTVEGALNAFTDHNELYWNVISDTLVPTAAVQVTVTLPAKTQIQTECYQGYYGSKERCKSAASGTGASYSATRLLNAGEGLTVVTGWRGEIVEVPPPLFKDRLSIDDFFTFDAVEIGGAIIAALAALTLLLRLWWIYGRDRAYKTLYYLTNDPAEGTRSLFARRDIVVEYLPPDRLRPAQMGVILDERADTLDVTATIIDLAVRGHLHITEVEKKGWFGKTDWKFEKKENPGDALLRYEQELYDAIFEGRQEVRVSALKNKFASDLGRVKSELYKDAVARRWFKRSPESTRNTWLAIAFGMAGVGALMALVSGLQFSRALIPVPFVVGGLLMLPLSRAMPRRTATGSEVLRRVLGFRLYIATAETRRQEFNEQQNIFATYLPFAIVFGCVEKWAKAFEGLDDMARQSTTAWYTGMAPFQVMAFTAGMRGFASTVNTTIASTPGSSGGSGFGGGGFSGGGGGGGGVGSW